jgi:hypothetical protein
MKLTRLQWLGIVAWVLLSIAVYVAMYPALRGVVTNGLDMGKSMLVVRSGLLKIPGVRDAGIQMVSSSETVGGSTSQILVQIRVDANCSDQKALCETLMAEAASTTISNLEDLHDSDYLAVAATHVTPILFIINMSTNVNAVKTVAEWRTHPSVTLQP